MVRIDVDLIGRQPTGEIVQRLARRIAAERLNQVGLADQVAAGLREAASFQFVRTPKKYHVVTIPGGRRVGGGTGGSRMLDTPTVAHTNSPDLPLSVDATASVDGPPTPTPFAKPPTAVLSTPPSSPAAWHGDPTKAHELRYWDGTTWTAHVSDSGRVSVDPL